MKITKSELRKLVREVISEQDVFDASQGLDSGIYFGGPGSPACNPNNNPNCVQPDFYAAYPTPIGGAANVLRCPEGFVFQFAPDTGTMSPSGQVIGGISNCVPDIGSPGDMAGHGSTDDPFVPGMGFEDQFIDQITGPGGPFGGSAKSGGSGKGKPIRESKKRHK